ncbi:hypothetical protein KP509_33G047200 [Ceratopteris richardii]|uniref:Uncharacterized protein n=1 Tax=Ceratopteris richardii TaxID=49495 RepID=A0A8T2QR31_CERRI|nr:hypothetical protein KP509_33G047200 [Ceratopteris richardii]
MASFGSFAGLIGPAMGLLSTSEAQLLGGSDFSPHHLTQQPSSQVSSKKQDLKHSQQCPLERRSLLSRLYVEKRTTESNNSGCFDIVFG